MDSMRNFTSRLYNEKGYVERSGCRSLLRLSTKITRIFFIMCKNLCEFRFARLLSCLSITIFMRDYQAF